MAFGKMRQLVESDNVVFGALILINVVFRCAVPEINAGAVFEFSRMRGRVEGVDFVWKEREGESDERFVKLGEPIMPRADVKEAYDREYKKYEKIVEELTK